jgi:hypothetical protein
MTWRRGLQRLTFVLWLGGVALLWVVAHGDLSSPFELRDFAGETTAPSVEIPGRLCEKARGGLLLLDGSHILVAPGEVETFRRCVFRSDLSDAELREVDEARAREEALLASWRAELRRAFLTGQWWRECLGGPWLKVAGVWTLLCWGGFYLVAWVVAGFRPRRR